jgi:hypothetical protein
LPSSEQVNEQVITESSIQQLGEEVQVGNQCSLQDDGNVRSIEELDWVGSLSSTHFGALYWEINSESLEVDNNDENESSGEQVGQVGEILPIESFLQSSDFILSGDEKMEKSNDGSFEFSSSSGVNGGRAEGSPNDVFTNVGSDEERNSRSKSISLL